MPKSVHSKERASSLPTAAAVIESIVRGAGEDDANMQYGLACAAPELRKLVKAGISELHIHARAASLARRLAPYSYEQNESLLEGVDGAVDDAIGALRMDDASAAFVLGLLAGQQLAGGVR